METQDQQRRPAVALAVLAVLVALVTLMTAVPGATGASGALGASAATGAAGTAATAATAATGASAARRPPVDGPVVRPFVAPAHEYGPGHRGVDLRAAAGAVVRSPAAGTVTFAGQVAGRGVVVVEHAGGTLTSLEPVTATLARGSAVVAGSPVAVVAPAPPHAGCAGGCVHWGVRVDGRYVDPVWWLGRGRAVRLLPLAGAV